MTQFLPVSCTSDMEISCLERRSLLKNNKNNFLLLDRLQTSHMHSAAYHIGLCSCCMQVLSDTEWGPVSGNIMIKDSVQQLCQIMFTSELSLTSKESVPIILSSSLSTREWTKGPCQLNLCSEGEGVDICMAPIWWGSAQILGTYHLQRPQKILESKHFQAIGAVWTWIKRVPAKLHKYL